MPNHAIDFWMEEIGAPDQQAGFQPPTGGPDQGGVPSQGSDPNVANIQQNQQQPTPVQPTDISNDPVAPDMPPPPQHMDFERFRNQYLKESIKGDTEKLLDMLKPMRDSENLDVAQEAFIEENYQIQMVRRNSNVDKASKEIRKNMRQELDRNNPAVSTVNHILNALEAQPELVNEFIKISGLYDGKGPVHRKYLSSLIGGVQVGAGGPSEDIIFNDTEYSIRISSRMSSRFGDVILGPWCLRQDEPQRFLSDDEMRRLSEGSPEEKDVLRRRVIMESIATTYQQRAFIVNVCGTDGTIYWLGWDLATSLRAAYTEGKLIVKTLQNDNQEAQIDNDGNIIPLVETKIVYAKEAHGETDADGKPVKREYDFLKQEKGLLFLTASLEIIREAGSSFQGIVFKESPYQGNPSDLKSLKRCVPSTSETLFRIC